MTYIFEIVAAGDGYETLNTTIGFADSEEKAQELVDQAKILNPHLDYNIKTTQVNFLLSTPHVIHLGVKY